MNLSVNSNGDLQEQTNCDPCDSQNGGSDIARSYVSGLISSKSTLTVGESSTDASYVNRSEDANHVNFSSAEAYAFESSLKGKDKLTMGAGMLFLHESLHTETGAGVLNKKPEAFNDGGKFETGGAVDYLNGVRSQLGIAKRVYYRSVPVMSGGEALILRRGNARLNLPMEWVQRRKQEYRTQGWKATWSLFK